MSVSSQSVLMRERQRRGAGSPVIRQHRIAWALLRREKRNIIARLIPMVAMVELLTRFLRGRPRKRKSNSVLFPRKRQRAPQHSTRYIIIRSSDHSSDRRATHFQTIKWDESLPFFRLRDWVRAWARRCPSNFWSSTERRSSFTVCGGLRLARWSRTLLWLPARM